MPLLSRRRPLERRASQTRALTASAQRIPIGDRGEAKRLQYTRQPWQLEAWAYRRSLGELRYACAYLGNSASRMRLYPGCYVPGDQEPIELSSDIARDQGIPSDLMAAAHDVLSRLGAGGPLAIQSILKKLTENFEVAGECYLVGRVNPITLVEEWGIRSVSELVITTDGRVGIRETPQVAIQSNAVDWLDPNNSTVIRLWWPDPEFGELADSPVRAILDICEELLLLGRDVRATAKSRLANNGLLMLPDSLQIVSAGPDGGEDPEQDPFIAEFIATATTALTDEGSAAALMPLLLRGPQEAIAAVKHLQLQRPANAQNMAQRQELISRMATGIDLPSEVLTGKADLNHWTAWQVSDDAFRHHIEPIVVTQVDALTAGYFWAALDAYNRWDPALIRRLIIWYDPTLLVTHPDRTADAQQAFDRGAIGREALRKIAGMSDDDKPDELDEILYILAHARGVDPVLLTAILKTVAKTIHIPDQVQGAPGAEPAGGAPANGPGGALPPADGNDVEPGPPAGGPPAATPPPAGPPSSPAAGASTDSDHWRRLAKAQRELESVRSLPRPPALVAAATKAVHPDSRKLNEIDRDLRARLQVAAHAAVKRVLEKAGAKVVSKSRTASAGRIRDLIRDTPSWAVPARVGPALVATLGLTEAQLLDTGFDELRKQWDRWVANAQRQVAQTAAKIVGHDPAAAWERLQPQYDQARNDGWNALQASLTAKASDLLSSVDGEDDEVDAGGGFVSNGMLRNALAIAGGFLQNPSSAGLSGGRPVDPTEPLTGIGNGFIATDFLGNNGAEAVSYTWVHGASDRPFEPHADLDGETFNNFDDPGLAVDGSFPDTDFYAPGDHDGCSCDWLQNWSVAGSGDGTNDEGDGEEAMAASAALATSLLTGDQLAMVRAVVDSFHAG